MVTYQSSRLLGELTGGGFEPIRIFLLHLAAKHRQAAPPFLGPFHADVLNLSGKIYLNV
jgi:hypothetical protein